MAANAAEGQRSVIIPPLTAAMRERFRGRPEAYRQFLEGLPRIPEPTTPTACNYGPWYCCPHTPGVSGLHNPLLLTDGSVIVHAANTPSWYQLWPDNAGDYLNQNWSAIKPLPVMKDGVQYAPEFFASAVLPD